jgi:CheY-like chemotaxis protein/nitrogen-specific signal transduction histidine kinase/HPt (histidine-containing phosphotransfer) domain-containing protein
MVQDITKQHLDKIELKKAKEKAEEADNLKSAFLANMSHEIRTPMNAIMGFSKLLTEKELPQQTRKQYADFIYTGAVNLLKLINDILDVAKIEAGQLTIRVKPCRINPILDELYSAFEQQKISTGKSHITLTPVKAVTDNGFAIMTDPLRLRQILTNLLGNALKFVEKGYIKFGYEIVNDKTLKFFVQDTGIGVPLDKRDLIFSRFGQIEGGKIKNPGGTGLGLSISKHLVEMLGGKIDMQSVINKGTTFWFTLPYVAAEGTDQKEDEHFVFNPLSIDGLKLLIVEDNKVNQTLIADVLTQAASNITFDFADDGAQAIERYNTAKYDLIFMDVRLPDQDGYSVTKTIRNIEQGSRRTPIIGLSAHAMKEAKEEGLEAGMDDFISKPFQTEELFYIIQKFAGRKVYQQYYDKTERKIETPVDYKLFNPAPLLQLYKNNPEKLRNIIKLYSENLEEQLAKLRNFIGIADFERAKITAHGVKTALRYLGIEKGAEIAAETERACAKKESDLSMINEIDTLWQKAKPEINQFLKN